MSKPSLTELTKKLESVQPLSRPEKAAVVDAVDSFFPGRSIWPEAHPEQIGSTDVALHVVHETFPNWAIKLRGKASETHGDWVCTLRKSGERDNDEVIGIGKGMVPAHAILAACLRLVDLKHHM